MQAETQVDTTPLPVTGTRQAVARGAKRIFDLVISLIGLVILSPLFLWIVWRVHRDSPGPVIYKGKRSGMNGKQFLIYKFRTMHEDEFSYQGPPITAHDDARVTNLGRWLRETKLNELPQFWNVIKGDMSFVGPRPEDPGIVQTWHASIRREILSVRPGITSPASVLYRREEEMLNGGQMMDTYLSTILPSKMRLDQLYVRHRSFWLDLDILFWTVILLLPRLGAFNPPERMLFIGPFTRFVRNYLNWFMIDTVVSLVSIGIAGLFFRSFAPLDVGWLRAVGIAVLYSLLFSFTCAVLKVNKITWSEARGEDILPLVPATFTATVLAVVTITIFRNPEQASQPYVPYGMIFMASLLSFIGFVFVRFRQRIVNGLETRWLARWSEMPVTRERVLVVGGGESGQIANSLLTTSTYGNHFNVIGYVDDDMYKLGTRIQGLDVLGRRENIPELVKKHDIGIIIFAIHNISTAERKRFLDICASTPARTILFPDLPAALDLLVSVDAEGQSAPYQPEDLFKAMHHQDRGSMEWGSGSSDAELPTEEQQWLAEMESCTAEGDLEGLKRLIEKRKRTLQENSGQHLTRSEG